VQDRPKSFKFLSRTHLKNTPIASYSPGIAWLRYSGLKYRGVLLHLRALPSEIIESSGSVPIFEMGSYDSISFVGHFSPCQQKDTGILRNCQG